MFLDNSNRITTQNLPGASSSAKVGAAAVIVGLCAVTGYYWVSDHTEIKVQRRAGAVTQVTLNPRNYVQDRPQAASKSAEVERVVRDNTPKRTAIVRTPVAHAAVPSSNPTIPASQPQGGLRSVAFDDARTVSSAEFQTALLSHITKYRQYPESARQDHQTGIVQVRFSLDRDGAVLDAWVQSSSGHPLLDQEAVATVYRAQPMPRLPEHWPPRVDLVMPVSFALM